jgi:hypothetical protein
MKTVFACTVATLAFIAMDSTVARATPNFPPAIQSYLPTPSAPACEICHVGPQQLGTVRTAFGTAMRARGLVAFDETSLRAALDKMAADKVDSDGDGVTDIDALKAGTDPNGGGAATVGPEYGCNAASTNGEWAIAVVSALVAVGSIRRARLHAIAERFARRVRARR